MRSSFATIGFYAIVSVALITLSLINLHSASAQTQAISADVIVASLDKDRDKRISKGESNEQLKPYFENFDTNGDGFVDIKEAQALAKYANAELSQADRQKSKVTSTPPALITALQIVSSMDANGNKSISENEASDQLKPYFGQFDTNGDGEIDVKEAQPIADYANGQAAQKRQPANHAHQTTKSKRSMAVTVKQIMQSMDKDRDRRISKLESSDDLILYFGKFDIDRDGWIDAAEAKSLTKYFLEPSELPGWKARNGGASEPIERMPQ